MDFEIEAKREIYNKLEEAMDELSELKDGKFRAIWGNETIKLMTEAAYSVLYASIEAQEYSLDEGYTKVI